MNLEVRIDPFTDFVGTFDPLKVVDRVKRAFPETVLDPTDYQAARLARELKISEMIIGPFRTTFLRHATRDAQSYGPCFRFEIPSEAGPIKGQARRYSVTLNLPDGVDDEVQGRLESFLEGLRLGQPEWCPRR